LPKLDGCQIDLPNCWSCYPHSSYSKSIPKRNIPTSPSRICSTVPIFPRLSSPISCTPCQLPTYRPTFHTLSNLPQLPFPSLSFLPHHRTVAHTYLGASHPRRARSRGTDDGCLATAAMNASTTRGNWRGEPGNDAGVRGRPGAGRW
jgi:hypothetical protein